MIVKRQKLPNSNDTRYNKTTETLNHKEGKIHRNPNKTLKKVDLKTIKKIEFAK